MIKLKTNNEYLEGIAKKVGNEVPDEHRTDNYYLKRIEDKITTGGSGFSGDYNDLINKPDIPDEISDLSDGSEVVKKSNTAGLLKNDGTVDTNTYLTQHQDISGKANSEDLSSVAFSGEYQDLLEKPTIPSKVSQLQNDSGFLTEHQDISNYVQKSQTSGLIKNDGTIDTNTYLTQHQSLDSKTVTVEKQSSAESGYSATYIIKQNNVQVGEKINIPKDFLVKSASVKTCTHDDDPVTGYRVGDLYIEFVINVHSGIDDNEFLYLNVNDFVDVYTGDNSTVVVSNNVISVKPNVFALVSHTHTVSDITNFPSLANVATSGSYNDLSNKPTIPSDVSDLTDLNSKIPTDMIDLTDNYDRIPTDVSDLENSLNRKFEPMDHTHTVSDIDDARSEFAQLTHSHVCNEINDISDYYATKTHYHDDSYAALYHSHEVADITDLSIPSDVSDLTDSYDTEFTPKSHEHTTSDITDFPTIPSKTSDLTNDSGFLTSHQDISGKLNIAQTSYKGKNVVVDGTTGNITFEEKNNHSHSEYLTSHQDITGKLDVAQTSYKGKNVVVDSSTGNITFENKNNHTHSEYLTSHQDISGKLNIAQTDQKGKNVVVDSTTGNITFENKPTIPTASNTTPSADVANGAIGSSSAYAKADHQHPLSTAYAASEHSHSNMEVTTNRVTSNQGISSSSTDTTYPTAKAVYTYIDSIIGDADDWLTS